MKNWQKQITAPQDVLVWTKMDDEKGERMIQQMTKRGNLWWVGDTYVYYTPTHWSY